MSCKYCTLRQSKRWPKLWKSQEPYLRVTGETRHAWWGIQWKAAEGFCLVLDDTPHGWYLFINNCPWCGELLTPPEGGTSE